MKFKFLKTIRYTEIVEVEAQDLESAQALAFETDGEYQNDDSLQEITPIPQ